MKLKHKNKDTKKNRKETKIQNQSEENKINSIRNLFILKNKKNKNKNGIIKDSIIRDNRILFEEKYDDYYKPKRVSNSWNHNYIEYESNENRNKNLSLEEHLNKIKP